MVVGLIIVVISGFSLTEEFKYYIINYKTMILLFLLVGLSIQTLYSIGKWKATKIAIFK
jgi:hypothetical protein